MRIFNDSKQYVRYANNMRIKFPGNFIIDPGSTYGRFQGKDGKPVFWVCDSYILVNKKLPIHIFNGMYWELVSVPADHVIYQCVVSMCKQLGRVPNVGMEILKSMKTQDFQDYMKHDRRHKKGSGSRISTNQINNVLRWNEVTEIAHWYGKGNASVVATNIRE